MKLGVLLLSVAMSTTLGLAQVTVGLPTTNGNQGDTVLIPVTVGDLTGLSVLAYQFAVSFDHSVLTALDVSTAGTLSQQSGWTVLPNVLLDSIKVGAFGASALSGSGTLVQLKFRVSGTPGATTPLTFSSFLFNAGTPDATTTNGTFTVVGVLQLIAPNGGELWQVGTQHDIMWNSSAITDVKIEYSTDDGSSWLPSITASTPANTGTYTWTIPKTPSTQGRVRISDVSNAGIYDLSDGTFTIGPLPGIPTLSQPANNAFNQAVILTLQWSAGTSAETYRVQLSVDSLFSNPDLDDSLLTVTNKPVGPLNNETLYYWRVKSYNVAGESNWSSTWSFSTIPHVPSLPILVQPPNNAQNQLTSLRLKWNRVSGASLYRLQLASDLSFVQGSVILDSTLTDTSRIVSGLANDIIHFWRVNASNVAGTSDWSGIWTFRTSVTAVEEIKTIPTEYSIAQNFPNPWNPSTTIRYGLPQRSPVSLTVFNTLGQLVANLVQGEQEAGVHEVRLDGSRLASGVYLYRIEAGNFVDTKKLLLLR